MRSTPLTLSIVLLARLGSCLGKLVEVGDVWWYTDEVFDPDAPLVAAAREGLHDEAQRLIDEGVDPDQRADARSATPLLASVSRGDIRMIHLLLDGGADIEKVGRIAGQSGISPLEYACMCRGWGRVDVMVELLIRGADIGETLICTYHYNFIIPEISEVAQEWKAQGRAIEAEPDAFVKQLKEAVFNDWRKRDPWCDEISPDRTAGLVSEPCIYGPSNRAAPEFW